MRTGKGSQRGLSAFGGLVVIAIAVVALYYVYQAVMGEDPAPTCASEFESCMKNCRATRTDNEAVQACQAACQRESDLCRLSAERRGK